MTFLSLNVGNFITLKLSPTNYPLWREQALALAESQELLGHLTNEDPAPPQYTIPNSSNTPTAETYAPRITEAYIAWQKVDRLLRGWIIGTLSEEILSLVVGLDTTNVAWEALKNAYAENSQEREFTLRQQVTYLRKEYDKTIGEHIRTFKSLCDSLATIGKRVPNKEKVFCLLTSLGPQYETFTTTMLKPPRPSYSELVSQLQSLDQRRNWFSNHANATHALTLKWPSTDSNNKDIHNPPPNIKATNKHSLQREEDSRHNNQRTKTMATPLAQRPVVNKDNFKAFFLF
ncbi:Retrovirus-related Pol polyprotein from transposon RE1 [Vitis vinifera]|uniref:Retrovirus-related Pol polyprotein from transposon RE1 n=1 Tax=Vitis vinifera TaxID=29760 RepID=A0A438EEM0_VITVI|nr:Retrovirus-related Pol polyprotein from transposon RE1 [Vitis vinifera]